jgi:hypothetical protein
LSVASLKSVVEKVVMPQPPVVVLIFPSVGVDGRRGGVEGVVAAVDCRQGSSPDAVVVGSGRRRRYVVRVVPEVKPRSDRNEIRRQRNGEVVGILLVALRIVDTGIGFVLGPTL